MVHIPVNYDVDYRQRLPLDRCSWCAVAKPTLTAKNVDPPISIGNGYVLIWATYTCTSCHHIILAHFTCSSMYVDLNKQIDQKVVMLKTLQYFPSDKNEIDAAIPADIADLMADAIEIKNRPRPCSVACGTAVEAMLKTKSLTNGNLSDRINEAVEKHIITKDMGDWAHHIRLERNANTHEPLGESFTTDDSNRCIDFMVTLADILFVFPARVTRGINAVTQSETTSDTPDDKAQD